MHLERVSIVSGQSVSAEPVGSWKASLNSVPMLLRDSYYPNNFSTAATVYRVVTVLVSDDQLILINLQHSINNYWWPWGAGLQRRNGKPGCFGRIEYLIL